MGRQIQKAGTAVPGTVLVLCFLFGVSLYLYRDRVPHNGGLALLAAGLSLLLLYSRYGGYFAALPVAYLTTYLGLWNPKPAGLPRGGDYSYGVYLYGFPIQQAVAAMGDWTHNPIASLGLACPLIAIVAHGSWHFVERPALSARKLQPMIDEFSSRLVRRARRMVFRAPTHVFAARDLGAE